MSDSDPGTPYKSADDLPDGAREALGELLLRLADDKRLLGLRYSDWILGAPSVEAGISCSAMAQDEWGHGRIVYAMLKDFGRDPDRLEHERESGEYRSSELTDADVASWADLVALNLLHDTALTIVFEALLDSRFEPIHYKVRKLLDEERYHFEHARGWTARLAETPAGRGALDAAFRSAWNACLASFGPDDDPLTDVLVEHGILTHDSVDMRQAWLDRVGPVVHAAELDLVRRENGAWRSGLEVDFDGWSADRRRAAEGGPDEDTLARARGDRNRSLLMD